MSNVFSDLEEGEIVDDPPSPVCLPKPKKLPRRYTLKDSQNKHKKSCKHHTLKLGEVYQKKSPRSSSSRVRSVKLSCKQARSSKPVRHYSPFPKKNSTPSLDTIKLKSILDLTKLKSSKPDLKSDVASCDFSEISAMYEKVRAENIKNNLGKTSSDIDYSQREIGIKSVENKHIPNFEKEESEDEEELRRIALSTCMVKTAIIEPEISKHFIEDIDLRFSGATSRLPKHIDPLEADKPKEVCEATSSTVNPIPSIANNYKVAGLGLDDGSLNIHPPIADNYEVIDMELDDDDNGGGGKSDDLFVIDTKPSVDLQTNSNSTAEKQSVVSDDDFELDILRAELIENMYRPSTNETKSHNLNMKASLKNQKKFVSQKTKRPPTAITKGKVTKFQKRLIITLNAESSDESEDEEDAKKTFPENPVASIEALISDIRQKSDEAKEIPTAVSCLSKAQQEEYNALMKILEKKKQDVPEENKVAHSPVNDLKVLEEKLIEVSELLKGKKSKLQELLKDVARHKQVYMKSKLTAQLLKEQFVAAEKVRRLKLQSWSNCCKKYEVAKKTVSELEFKTDNLKNLCSRVGSSINGRSYSLPTTSSFS